MTDQPPSQPPEEIVEDKGTEEEPEEIEIDLDEEPAGKPADEKKSAKDEDEDEDDEDLPEEDKKMIDKHINKRISSFEEKQRQSEELLHKQQVQSELSDILSKNPEYKPYEARIRKWVEHPNRAGFIKSGLPVASVVSEAIAPYMMKIGAERERIAREKADKSKDGGNQQKPKSPDAPDYSSMSNEEISSMAEQIKSGRYKGKV